MKSLSSRLNNRIELWEEVEEKIDIGIITNERFVKKIWADIVPQSGLVTNGPGETEPNITKFKIRIRKTVISSSNFIIFKNKKYEINYILPDFNKNAFMDIFANLYTE